MTQPSVCCGTVFEQLLPGAPVPPLRPCVCLGGPALSGRELELARELGGGRGYARGPVLHAVAVGSPVIAPRTLCKQLMARLPIVEKVFLNTGDFSRVTCPDCRAVLDAPRATETSCSSS